MVTTLSTSQQILRDAFKSINVKRPLAMFENYTVSYVATTNATKQAKISKLKTYLIEHGFTETKTANGKIMLTHNETRLYTMAHNYEIWQLGAFSPV